ncbi:MAG TPA: hypothetical protein VFA00_01450 [Actinomycetota bacterium]|jgi:hypothetical protein|nr:hypothetical protein [Actinomycetota bacterium]
MKTRVIQTEPNRSRSEDNGPRGESAASGWRLGRLLVFVGPLLWAALILFHPMPGGDSAYQGVKNDLDLWLLVHVGQLILTPFLFLAVWRLLQGLPSVAAMVSRAALVVWTVFFSAYDTVQGISTGLLADHANGLTGQEQTGVAGAIDFLIKDSPLAGNISAFWVVASVAWLVVAIAAAVALRKAGAGKAVVMALCVSIVFATHVQTAAIGLVALSLAGVLRERQRRKLMLEVPDVMSPADAPARGAPA